MISVMKTYMIGDVEIPRRSPQMMKCRVAVRKAIQEHALTEVIVGLSGGADSTALVAAALAEGLDVLAVSIDHGLQNGSHEVSVAACKRAERMGAQTLVVSVKVPSEGSMEAQARDARYAALRRVAQGRPIMIAHTMDDQAETMMLGLMRGKGSGMSEVNGDIVRPLLSVRRSDTVGACEELGLEYWSDPQNDDLSYDRVFVRKSLLPAMNRQGGVDAVRSVASAASMMVEDNDLLESMSPLTDDCGVLEGLHPALRRRSVVKFLHANEVTFSAEALAQVLAMVGQWKGQKPVGCGDKVISRIQGKLVVKGA